MAWTRGQQLNNRKYVVEEKLGEGSFGMTYLAKTPAGDRLVIKTLNETVQAHSDFTKYQQDFLNEALRLARCQHPHIVKVHKLFQETVPHPTQARTRLDLWCIALEYIDGEDLARYAKRRGTLSEAEALNYIRQLGEALMVVHEQGMLHRDVKPQNMMLRSRRKEAVLLDVGIARDFVPDVTLTHSQVATPGYAPIEQYDSHTKRGAYTDVYALAATLYELVTGTVPPDAVSRDQHLLRYSRDLLTAPKALNPLLSDRLNTAILKGLTIKPEYRPETMVHWFHNLGLKTRHTPATVTISPPTRTPQIPIRPPSSAISSSPSPTKPRLGPVHRSRRHLLRWVGLGSMGLALAVVTREFWTAKSLSLLDPNSTPPEPPPEPIQNVVSISPESQPEPEPSPTTPSGTPLAPLTLPNTVEVNAGGDIINERPVQVQVYDENLGNGVSLRMVDIPGGSYVQGSPDNEVGRNSSEGPQRTVTIPQFYMGMFQITQAQYATVVGENPSFFRGDNRPVEKVTWHQAQAFCDRLSERTGRRYALPSEAQWEYACRAGTTTPFHYGATLTDRLANYHAPSTYENGPAGQYREETTEVGRFPPNDFGLFDMHGNVWEWCADHYRNTYDDVPNTYDGVPTDGSPYITNDHAALRILRGGSWQSYPHVCRSANRLWDAPFVRNGLVGFRVVSLFS